MKPLPRLLLTVFLLTGLADAGCAEKEKVAAPAPSAPVAVSPPAPATTDADARWADLKNYSFDQRDLLLAALKPLLARVDEQVDQLKAKRAILMKNDVDLTDWDFAMKEMSNARSYLAGMAQALGQARRENWDEQKGRLGRAWERTQAAYAKVRASTTS